MILRDRFVTLLARLALIGSAMLAVSCGLIPTELERQHLASKMFGPDKASASATPSESEGEKRYSDGTVYTGQLKNGKPHGKGVLRKADGSIYRGEFRAGWMSGVGELRFPKGTVYKGQFDNDTFSGKGLLTDASGNVSEGIFAEGELRKGRVKYKRGGHIEGTFKGDTAHGTYRAANGDLMEGGFVRRVGAYALQGRAVHRVAETGRTYTGSFTNGTKDGEFIAKLSSGAELFQIWDQGRIAYQTYGGDYLKKHKGRCDLGQGNKWILVSGKCRKGVVEGPAVFTYEDSSAELDAVFKGGLAEGTMKFRSGRVYRGTFNRNLKPHGSEVSEIKGSRVTYVGGFNDGVRAGSGLCYESHSKGVSCEYRGGERIDAVYLAKQMTNDVKALEREHKSYVSKQVDAGIAAQKEEIKSRYNSRVRQLKKEMESYRTMQATGAALGILAEGFATGGQVSDRHEAEARQNIERKRRQIEEEKQRYRRELAGRERAWAERRKTQLSQYEDRYDRKFKEIVARYKARCTKLEGRKWQNNVCMPDAGLPASDVAVLNNLLDQQYQADGRARNASSQVARKLGSYQQDASNRWGRLDRVAREENAEYEQRLQNDRRFKENVQQLGAEAQRTLAESRAKNQQLIEDYNRRQEEEYQRKKAEHERQQQAIARRREQERERAVQARQAQETARKAENTKSGGSSGGTSRVGGTAVAVNAPSSSGGAGGDSGARLAKELESEMEREWGWDENRLMACGAECKSISLFGDDEGTERSDAIKACEKGCDKMHLESKAFSGWKINCDETAEQLPTWCAEKVGGLEKYCMRAMDIWKNALGCTQSKGW